MATNPIPIFNVDEYLKIDEGSERPVEFYQGEVIAMAGGTRRHTLIVGNVYTALRVAGRRRGCEVYASDLRVRVAARGPYFYPDVQVVCGTPEIVDERGEAVANPVVIVEVLSPSTEDFDRGRKLMSYTRIPSLREYLLVSQSEARITCYRRLDGGDWHMQDLRGMDAVLHLHTLEADILLRDVYEDVPLDPAETD